jgi:type VI secretion system protein VasG
MITVDLKALLNRLNGYCKRSLEAAAGLCVSRGNYEVTIEHLLLKLVEDPGYDFQCILRHFEIDASRVQKALQHAVEQAKMGNSGRPVFSPLLIEWFEEAWLLASVEMRMVELRSGVLVVALLLTPSRFAYAAYADELRTIPADTLRRDFLEITAGSHEEMAPIRAEKTAASEVDARRQDSALGRFTIDFTGRARAGDIDPVFCRDREIRQIIDILGRRRKNNPIAVGEAGVGKTAVIEGLALKIVQGDVPDVLKEVDIYGLDLGLLQAGAGVRGEFESRVKAVLDEVKASPKPIILFIDEAHTLIGAGGPAGGGDAANLLKPALARGELRTIAATTWSEYKKYFEKDAALARRFQLVTLDEPSPENTVVILRGLRATYEAAHGVYVRDDAIVAAAELAARYISGRQLPDKAVDLLDTACARVKISISAKPHRLDDQEKYMQVLERELSALQRDIATGESNDVERVAELEGLIRDTQEELQGLASRWHREQEMVSRVIELRRQLAEHTVPPSADNGQDGDESLPVDAQIVKKELESARAELDAVQGDEPLLHFEVTPDVISRIVSDWTGIPVGNMVQDEAQAILRFQEDLKQRIKGQDHAIEVVDRCIRAAKAGIGNPYAPMGVLLFVGPSGVGKTECALGIAALLFGGERFVVSINMSEFQEKHTVSRLIGSPPGYVGYGEGGILTEAVRQRPYSVVLLDEVEKADPEVMNLFYQVFDKGVLADGEGRVIDFKNTIVCMTSNLASDIITQLCADGQRPDLDVLLAAIRPVLSHHFKPALLARMEIVPFLPLFPDVMQSIVELKLQQLARRLRDSQKMHLTYAPQVVEQIAARCTEVETGARNIDHIMNGTLIPEISTQILQTMGTEAVPHTLELDLDADGHFSYRFLP